MACGISTANFFPENTLSAFSHLTDAHVPLTELFFNTFSEMDDDFVEQLLAEKKRSGIRVAAVHPFSAQLEGFFFASHYETRFSDGLKFYRRFFEICVLFEADKLVFHGDHSFNMDYFAMDKYAWQFAELAHAARQYGVTLCHENVSYCRLGDPAAVRAFRSFIGDEANFVLDTKQVKRKGARLEDMIDAMGGGIRHVHISDFDATHNCLPPGQGEMDFPAFIAKLRQFGYDGDYIIELYRENFEYADDLFDAMQYVNALL